VAVAVLCWLALRNPEPRYKGHTLTYWLAAYREADTGSAPEREAKDAIRQIGTNALPHLVARLRYKRPAWKMKAVGIAMDLPGPLDDWLTSLILEKEDKFAAASEGFEILGPAAAPAVPDLIELFLDKDTWEVVQVALMHVGEPAVPALTAALTNRSNPPRIRAAAADVLGNVGESNSAVVKLLLPCLEDEPHVARFSALALGRLKMEPDIVVPALAQAVTGRYLEVRAPSIWALGQFGTNATSALPLLTNLLDHPDRRIRDAVTNALENIAPGFLPPIPPPTNFPALEGPGADPPQ
jgi:hypothetical protein